MKCYPLGPCSPRFFGIGSSTVGPPAVITTGVAHGFSLADVITISGHATNTAVNGSYSNLVTNQFTLTPTTITLLGLTGTAPGSNTGFASAPAQLITVINFPVIPGVSDNSKLMVAKINFTAVPFGTAVLFLGGKGLNQGNFTNVFRGLNPPAAAGVGVYDFYDIDGDGGNVIPIAEYWVDARLPGTEAVLASFWMR